MPTSLKVQKKIFENLPPIHEGDIIELGSGWGDIAFKLAKSYKSHRVLGYENSKFPYFFSMLRLYLNPQKNLKIKNEDFFRVDLSHSALVFCYLYPKAMKMLAEKFKNELSPKTWIISHTFSIPGLEPMKTIIVDDMYHTKIYLYQIP